MREDSRRLGPLGGFSDGAGSRVRMTGAEVNLHSMGSRTAKRSPQHPLPAATICAWDQITPLALSGKWSEQHLLCHSSQPGYCPQMQGSWSGNLFSFFFF